MLYMFSYLQAVSIYMHVEMGEFGRSLSHTRTHTPYSMVRSTWYRSKHVVVFRLQLQHVVWGKWPEPRGTYEQLHEA